MKEAWKQTRQVLSGRIHITSVGYGLIQLFRIVGGYQVKDLSQEVLGEACSPSRQEESDRGWRGNYGMLMSAAGGTQYAGNSSLQMSDFYPEVDKACKVGKFLTTGRK